MIIDIYNIDRKYDIIYTDPPWQQTKGNLRKCRPQQNRNLDYPTLPLQEIADIHAFVSSDLVSPKHNIFMWTIDKYLFETEEMVKKLGYTLHARMVWDKENGVAPAFTIRFTHEYLLWFYPKGNMLKPCKEARGKFTSVLREKSTIHSRKPVVAYDMINSLSFLTPKS